MTWKRLLLVLPLGLLVLLFVLKQAAERRAAPPPQRTPSGVSTVEPRRLLLVIVDTMRPQNVDEPGAMPVLQALGRRPDARRFDFVACSALFSFQCLQTLLEGRESPFGPALTPLFSARTQSLGITKPDPVDYTLYRVDWAAADSIAAADPGAAADSGAAAGGPGPAPPR